MKLLNNTIFLKLELQDAAKNVRAVEDCVMQNIGN